MNKIPVPIATYRLAESPDLLVVYGVGSCVVVVLFDPDLKIGAMAHVMLPGKGEEGKSLPPAMYSEQAIEAMLKELAQRGSSRERLVAKIAGGAQMFALPSCSADYSPGQRNVEMVVRKLNDAGIPLIAADVGKYHGRSVEFHTDTGRMLIGTVSEGSKEI
jgi:chemotaxis protein CheD